MENLPAELKEHICSFLHHRDLRSVRFVNKTWAHVAVLSFFEAITITLFSLERLRLIAQHELIATRIRRITFHVDLLRPITLQKWSAGLARKRSTMPLAYQRYILAYGEQNRLQENDYKLSREILDSSIPMLRNLHRLKLTMGNFRDLCAQKIDTSRQNQQWYKVLYDLRSSILQDSGALRREPGKASCTLGNEDYKLVASLTARSF